MRNLDIFVICVNRCRLVLSMSNLSFEDEIYLDNKVSLANMLPKILKPFFCPKNTQATFLQKNQIPHYERKTPRPLIQKTQLNAELIG